MVDRKIEERVRRRDLRHYALERGMRLDRGGPLDPTAVTTADHADFSVRPALLCYPIDGVVTVLALVDQRRPLAAAFIASARVLNDMRVTAPGPPFAREFRKGLPAIRRSLEDHGVFAVIGRSDYVGDKLHAVAHLDLDAILGLRLHRGLAQLGIERRCVYQKGFMS